MTDLGFAHRPHATVLHGPLLTLFLCICGMAVGLAIDCGSVPLDVLASLCLAGSSTLAASARVHLEVLPATHVMMAAGAVLAVAMTEAPARTTPLRRYLPGAACASAMVAGMIIGGWIGPPVAGALGVGSSSAQLLTAMTLGMAAGMALTMPLYLRLSRHGTARRGDQGIPTYR